MTWDISCRFENQPTSSSYLYSAAALIHIVLNFKAKTPIWGQRGRTSKIGELPKAGKLLTFEAETLSKGGEPNFEKTIVLQEEVLQMFVFLLDPGKPGVR